VITQPRQCRAPQALWSAAACCRFPPPSLLTPPYTASVSPCSQRAGREQSGSKPVHFRAGLQPGERIARVPAELSHRLPRGEGGLRPASSLAGAGRAFARRRVMDAQGAQLATARRRVRGQFRGDKRSHNGCHSDSRLVSAKNLCGGRCGRLHRCFGMLRRKSRHSHESGNPAAPGDVDPGLRGGDEGLTFISMGGP
jgi:hypothetical protein